MDNNGKEIGEKLMAALQSLQMAQRQSKQHADAVRSIMAPVAASLDKIALEAERGQALLTEELGKILVAGLGTAK